MIHTLVYWRFSQKNVLLRHRCQKNCKASGKSCNPLILVFTVFLMPSTVCPKLLNLSLCSKIRHIFILLMLKPIIQKRRGLFNKFTTRHTKLMPSASWRWWWARLLSWAQPSIKAQRVVKQYDSNDALNGRKGFHSFMCLLGYQWDWRVILL